MVRSPDQMDSSSSPQSDGDIQMQALEELQLGKRALVMKDIRDAVDHFSNACQLLDSIYGSNSPECGNAYLLYGSALLEVSRLDNGVVDNNKLPAEEEEDDEEAEELDEADVSAAAEAEARELDAIAEQEESEAEAAVSSSPAPETAGSSAPEHQAAGSSASEPQTAGSSSANVEANTSTASTSAAGDNDPQPSTSKDEEDTEEEEPATDSELAWEMLDMARKIFTANEPSLENYKMLAETLQKLGEISLEWENVENAIDLLTESLSIRKEHDMHPRVIAQTYHFLAVATASTNEFDKSVTYMKECLALLETYLRNHQEAFDNEEDGVKKATHKLEIDDLESLLPEVQLQLEDFQAQEKAGYQTLAALEDQVDKSEKAATASVAAKPITNISHLVKRKVETVSTNGNGTSADSGDVKPEEKNADSSEPKRKIDEVDENSDPNDVPVKKQCTDAEPTEKADPDAQVEPTVSSADNTA